MTAEQALLGTEPSLKPEVRFVVVIIVCVGYVQIFSQFQYILPLAHNNNTDVLGCFIFAFQLANPSLQIQLSPKILSLILFSIIRHRLPKLYSVEVCQVLIDLGKGVQDQEGSLMSTGFEDHG